jgi:hypothetical protein
MSNNHAVLIYIALLLSLVSCDNSSEKLTRTQAIGDEIVECIYKYYDVHGTYPDNLLDLKPDYIQRIDPPVWGVKEWKYSRFQPGHFYLSVNANRHDYEVYCYDSRDKVWELDN